MTLDAKWLEKARPCKLGTIPAVVRVRAKSRVEVGRWIAVQEMPGQRWHKVLVTEVHPDGHFKADR